MELFRRSSRLTDFACEKLEVSLAGEFTRGKYDIGAIYQCINDKRGIVYFGNPGSLNAYPFIEHIDQRGQFNNIRSNFDSRIHIVNRGEIKKIWIIIWDHELFDLVKIPGQFREDGLLVKIAVSTGDKPILDEPITVYFNSDTEGNLAITPEIDLQNPENLSITNISNAYIIAGFKKYRDLVVYEKLDIIPGFIEKIMNRTQAA